MTPHDTREDVEAMGHKLTARPLYEGHGEESALPEEAAAMLRRLHQRAVDAERERDGANALVERMHSQDVLAIKAWHKAHPRNDLTWPDQMRLTAWCMGSVAQLVAERDAYRGNCTDALAENDALRFERNNLRAALATARADALREGLEAVKGIDTADIYSTGERHAAEEIRDFAVFLIGNLIEQPTTTTGEA